MRRTLSLLVVALVAAIALPAAQSKSAAEDRLVGKWSGTFDGDGNGSWSMAISRDAAKNLTGTLDAMPSGGDGYTATFKSIVVDGANATLKYDPPNGEPIEVQIDVTLEAAALKGTWKVIENASKSVGQTGTLEGTKK